MYWNGYGIEYYVLRALEARGFEVLGDDGGSLREGIAIEIEKGPRLRRKREVFESPIIGRKTGKYRLVWEVLTGRDYRKKYKPFKYDMVFAPQPLARSRVVYIKESHYPAFISIEEYAKAQSWLDGKVKGK